MTRTIQFSSHNSGENPLFQKLKKHFSSDERAVGDLLRQRMEGAEASVPNAERNTAAEHRVTRANFLPKEHGASSSHAMRSFESTMFVNKQFRTAATIKTASPKKEGFPVKTVLMLVACFCVLMLLIYSGMQINKLNREINDLKTEVEEKEEIERSLAADVEKRIDLQSIEKIALTNLGMVKNTTVEQVYVDINQGDSVDIP